MTIPTLSPRQVEVCALVVAGESDKAIGVRLAISKRTVTAHVEEAAKRIRKMHPHLESYVPRTVIRRFYVEFTGLGPFSEQP